MMLAWSVLISSVLALVALLLWLTMPPRRHIPLPPRVRLWDKDYNLISDSDWIIWNDECPAVRLRNIGVGEYSYKEWFDETP